MKKIIIYIILCILISSFVSATDFKPFLTLQFNGSYSGATVYDQSNWNNDGTDAGAMVISGNLLDYQKCDTCRINTPDTILPATVNDFSIEMWVNPDDVTTDRQFFFFMQDQAKDKLIWGEFNDVVGTLKFAAYSDGNDPQLTNAGYTTNTWYHIVFTVDAGGYARLYSNATEVANDTIGTPEWVDWGLPDQIILGGYRSGGDANNYNGQMQFPRVYNKTLSSAEVTELYNNGMDWDAFASAPPPANDSYHKVKVTNVWNSTNMAGVNITLNNSVSNLTQSDGIAYFGNYSGNFTFTGTKTNFYNITGMAQENQTVSYTMAQSEIDFNCFEMITNNSLTCTNGTIYPNANDYNFSIASNGYYNVIQEETINIFDNKTINITGFYSTNLTLDANALAGALTTCNFTVTSLNESFETIVSGSPDAWIGLINGTYNITADCDGFELKDDLVTIVNTTQTITFDLYTTNSIMFNFFDETTNVLIDFETITFELISSVFGGNYSTQNGTKYLDLLSPTTYTIRYESNDTYNERFYYFNLQNRTFTNLTLYLLNSSVQENITVTVYDQYNNFVEDAYIEIQRYDISTNSYVVKEIIKTNFEGQSEFLGVLNTEFYKFVVEFPFGTVVKTTSPTYLYTDSLIIKIQIGDASTEAFSNFMSLTYNLSFNNATNNFKYFYSDGDNILTQACLKVYKQSHTGNTLYNSSCSSSSSATLLVNVAEVNGTTYIAKAYATLDAVENIVDSLTYTFKETSPFDTDKSGIFYTFLLVIGISFIGLFNIVIALLLAPLGIIFASMIGFINISVWVGIGLEAIAIVIAILISNKS